MNKKEAKYQIIISQYMRQAKITCLYEVKYCGDKKLKHSQMEDQQIQSLLAVKHGSFNFKMPDTGISHSPADGFSMYKQNAFVIPVYKKFFALIDIDIFLEQKAPISDIEAKKLAYRIIYF